MTDNKWPTPIKVLDIPIAPFTMKQTLDWCAQRIASKKPAMLITANAEIVMMGQKDQEFFHILATADLVIPDGAGVVWAGRHLGYAVPERVAGCDLVAHLFEQAAVMGWSVFLLGGAPGVAESVADKMQALYPALRVCGARDGYFSPAEEPALVAEIQQQQPDVLFVALGVPRQEKWLQQHRDMLRTQLAIGVGGTFDVLAGTVERAPLWMQRYNLEWLYRLYKQPERFGRMLALPAFVWRVLRAKK